MATSSKSQKAIEGEVTLAQEMKARGPSKPRNRRTVEKREQDLMVVQEHYAKGVPVVEIARLIGVAVQTAYDDIEELERRWRKDVTMKDFNERKTTELNKINTLEKELWEEWAKSKQDVTRTTQKQVETDEPMMDHATGKPIIDLSGKPIMKKRYEVSVQTFKREGNVAIANAILGCIERRCKLLGLDAPDPSQVHLTLAKVYVGVDMEEV